MSDNKKQHFVPKYALRYFASDQDTSLNERKQIDLFNIRRKKTIRGASLRDQCYRDFLYGKNLKMENALSQLEGSFSPLIQQIYENNCLSDGTISKTNIAFMISLQRSRTLVAEEEINSLTNKFMRLVAYGVVDKEYLENIRISLREAASFNVASSLKTSPIIFDLKQILIVNKSSIPFIISDNPVCITNWFCRTKTQWNHSVGTANSGAQIFMPISPKHMILLLDNNVYTIGSSRDVLEISDANEIAHINRIQYLNAYKNIYFNGDFLDSCVSELSDVHKPDLSPSFIRADTTDGITYYPTNKTELDAPTEGARSELIHFAVARLPEDLRLKDIKFRPKPKYFDDKSAAGPRRDPTWISIVEDFDVMLSSGICKFSDFWPFVVKHHQVSKVGKWLKRLSDGVV